MDYAIIKTGGKQYRVRKGDFLTVEKLEGDSGDEVLFDQVLLTSLKGQLSIGEPIVSGAVVKAKIEDNALEKKTVTITSDDENLNIVAQMFEINDLTVEKLAIVDYGSYKNDDGSDAGCIYHLGKIFRDGRNVPKFVKIFTLIFEY